MYGRKCLEVGFTQATLDKVPVKIIREPQSKISSDEEIGVSGYYDQSLGHIILSKENATWKDAIHEIGHHFDYTIFDGRFSDEMADHFENLTDKEQPVIGGLSLSSYAFTDPREFIAEGFKEFVTDNDGLKRYYPEVYQSFVDVIDRINNNKGVYSSRDTKRNKNDMR